MVRGWLGFGSPLPTYCLIRHAIQASEPICRRQDFACIILPVFPTGPGSAGDATQRCLRDRQKSIVANTAALRKMHVNLRWFWFGSAIIILFLVYPMVVEQVGV